MQDYLTHLEKLRKDAAECRLISDLATDTAKRELFDRLASHLIILADQVEQEMLKRKPMSGYIQRWLERAGVIRQPARSLRASSF